MTTKRIFRTTYLKGCVKTCVEDGESLWEHVGPDGGREDREERKRSSGRTCVVMMII